MKPYDKNHPHNAVFCEQLQSVIDGKPKTAEYNVGDGIWQQLSMNKQGVLLAEWLVSCNYRIKPPEPVMVTRTVTYPAPMAVAPAIGTKYFALESSLVASYTWIGDSADQATLTQGRAFTNAADAQACWNALFNHINNL